MATFFNWIFLQLGIFFMYQTLNWNLMFIGAKKGDECQILHTVLLIDLCFF